MKLIIDIPEEIYIEKKEDYIGDTLDRAIANGTPLKGEFEKIRAEIQEEIFNSKGYVTYSNALMRCYEIVDKHISELKGE